MDVGGAALYSVAVMAVRGLSRLSSHAGRIAASAGHLVLEGLTLHGASFHSMPQHNQPSDDGR